MWAGHGGLVGEPNTQSLARRRLRDEDTYSTGNCTLGGKFADELIELRALEEAPKDDPNVASANVVRCQYQRVHPGLSL